MLEGWRGLQRNERGVGVRVLRQHVGPARMAIRPLDPMYDKDTVLVDVLGKYLVEGADIDTEPVDLAKGLREWGWPTLPETTWVFAGKMCAIVGAARPPPANTAYLDVGCLVINPVGQKGKEQQSGLPHGGHSGPLVAPPALGGPHGVATAARARSLSPGPSSVAGILAVPDGAWSSGAPLSLQLKQQASEMQTAKNIEEMNKAVQQQLSEAKREMQDSADRGRQELRTEFAATQAVTRHEMKVIKEAQDAAKVREAAREQEGGARHGEVLSVLDSLRGMFATGNSAGGATPSAQAAAAEAKAAEERTTREIANARKREFDREKRQKEEDPREQAAAAKEQAEREALRTAEAVVSTAGEEMETL